MKSFDRFNSVIVYMKGVSSRAAQSKQSNFFKASPSPSSFVP